MTYYCTDANNVINRASTTHYTAAWILRSFCHDVDVYVSTKTPDRNDLKLGTLYSTTRQSVC